MTEREFIKRYVFKIRKRKRIFLTLERGTVSSYNGLVWMEIKNLLLSLLRNTVFRFPPPEPPLV